MTRATVVVFFLIATSAAAQPASGTTPSGLFYEVSGAGTPIVFIHAFSVDRRMWQPQVAAFAEHHQVIRYDLRGHGKSVAPVVPYAGYEDLRELLDTLKIERATLIGLSAGSDVALNFALAYPNRVAQLVLVSPGLGGYHVGPLPWALPPAEAAARGEPERAAALWAETPIMALRHNVADGERLRALVADNSQLWTYRRLERPLMPAAAGRLGDIAIRTMIVTGAGDLPHIHEIAAVITAGIRSSRHVVIPAAGHIVNLDDSVAFNSVLSSFLTQ